MTLLLLTPVPSFAQGSGNGNSNGNGPSTPESGASFGLTSESTAAGILSVTVTADVTDPTTTSITAFLARLESAPGQTLESWSFAGTASEAALGANDPFFAEVTIDGSAVTIVVVYAADGSVTVPVGTESPLMTLAFSTNGDASPPTFLTDDPRPTVTLSDWRTLYADVPEPELDPATVAAPQAQEGEGGGSAALAVSESGLSGSTPECDYDLPLWTSPQIVDIPANETRIRQALTTPGPVGSPVLIRVAAPSSPVTINLSTPIVIDADLFPDGMQFISLGGTGAVTFDGGGTTRCLEVIGSLPGNQRVIIGDIDSQNPVAGQGSGFTFVNGFTTGVGGGIFLDNVRTRVDVIGNEIGLPSNGNHADVAGGGIGARNGLHAVIAYNEVRSNTFGDGLTQGIVSPAWGGGIGVDHTIAATVEPVTRVLSNVVSGNSPRLSMNPTDYGARWGGGIGVDMDADDEIYGSTFVCGNEVRENTAFRGCGLSGALENVDQLGPIRLFFEANLVAQNEIQPIGAGDRVGAQGGPRGGGIFVESVGSGLWELNILNNSIFENRVDSGVAILDGADPVSYVGGGISLHLDLEGVGPDPVRVHGNSIFQNLAGFPTTASSPPALDNAGGGLHFELNTLGGPQSPNTTEPPEFFNNTIFENEVVSTSAGIGGGAYFGPGTFFEWRNGVISDNTPALQDWFGDATLFGTFLSTMSSTNLSVPSGSDDLCLSSCDDSSPVLIEALDQEMIQLRVSPCIDSGDDSVAISGELQVSVDLNTEDRSLDVVGAGGGSILDRGSDEYTIQFIRGDCEGDLDVDVTDLTVLSTYLGGSSSLQNCEDAYDVNDDGVVDGADSSALIIYLTGGAGPPAPFPTCGFDPDPDNLLPCTDAMTAPCP